MTGKLGWAAIAGVLLFFVLSAGMVLADVGGADPVGDEQTVSLRDESSRGGGMFFVGYGRSHRGGGLHGGK